MINTLTLMLPIACTRCDAEGTAVGLLVMANYGCSYVALITVWSSPYHTWHFIVLHYSVRV